MRVCVEGGGAKPVGEGELTEKIQMLLVTSNMDCFLNCEKRKIAHFIEYFNRSFEHTGAARLFPDYTFQTSKNIRRTFSLFSWKKLR